LQWDSLETTPTDYTVFVHVVGPDGQTVAQQDWQPLENYAPTHLWHKGLRLLDDRYALELPPTLPSGVYEVRAGMYTPAGRLPVSRGNLPTGEGEGLAGGTGPGAGELPPTPAGDYAVVGTFEVP
jgi:hypothetical protein